MTTDNAVMIRKIDAGCAVLTPLASSERRRNTLVARLGATDLVIDPQRPALAELRGMLGARSGRLVVVVSHAHRNHFDGLGNLLGHLGREVETTVVAPASCCSLRSHVGALRLLAPCEAWSFVEDRGGASLEGCTADLGAEVVDATSHQVTLHNWGGHCDQLLIATLTRTDRLIWFLGDNLCTCFPTPITSGGAVSDLVSVLRRCVAASTRGAVYVPGHGRLATQADVESAIEYYSELLRRGQPVWPAAMTELDQLEMVEVFHRLNLQASKGDVRDG